MVNSFNLTNPTIKSTGNYIEEKKQKTIYLSTTKKADNKQYDKNYGYLEKTATSDAKIVQTKNYESLLNISKGAMLVKDNIKHMCLKVGATDLSGC